MGSWNIRADPLLVPDLANEHGLVAVGGDLRPERLLQAYRRGVFPWYEAGGPILWWSPDPRAIIELDGVHVSRRLARTLRSGRFSVSADRDFAGVIRGCADRPVDGTWITSEMIRAYEAMHRLGHAHSIEVWQDGKLAGGIYGVAIGGLFAGESMFTRIRDASKVALVHLVERLTSRRVSPFRRPASHGPYRAAGRHRIPRNEYLRRLRQALENPARFTHSVRETPD